MSKTLFSLSGKVAVVTGGGSGIGAAICSLFAEQGAKVYCLDLKLPQALADELNALGYQVVPIDCDVSKQAQVQACFERVVAESGRLDILVNNAGIAHIGTAEHTAEADFDRIFAVNVKGVYNCLHAAIPQMKAGGGGAILNMASIAATAGLKDRFAYSMSKGAVFSMTLSVAKDFIAEGIRCNCVSPARVHTPFVDGFLAQNYPGKEQEMFEKLSKTQPIGRMGKPEEVAQLVLFLCSDEAGFITGCDYPIDGGFLSLNS